MYIILAICIGFAVVISSILNGKLAQKVGLMNGMIVNYIIGFSASVLLSLVMREKIPTTEIFYSTPIYYFLGGVIGVLMLFLMNTIVPKISAVYIVILPFIGQLITGAIIDYFYTGVLSTGKIAGSALFFIGLLYNTRVDNKEH
jgi:uncharacterized membrane protein YdcZ (DUF606 family)